MLTGGKFQFVINLGDGGAASVTSPAKARIGEFQHVAASFDGATLRLFVGGVEVSHVAVSGEIPVGAGPLVMGNDGSERRFSGVIDSTVFATHALSADEIQQLTCLAEPPTVMVPDQVPAVPLGTAAEIDVAITNHNPVGTCAPAAFQVTTLGGGPIELVPAPNLPVLTAPIPSGQTGHFTILATPRPPINPGDTFPVALTVGDPVTGFSEVHVVALPVSGGGGNSFCVDTPHELMVTTTSVVDDPVRTQLAPGSSDPRNGVWTFKRLMEDMAPTPADAPLMVEDMLRSFTVPQVVNGFVVPPRPVIDPIVLGPWPRTPDGKLDLARAPLRLQAIVHRFDLRNLDNADAGEGRFVFAFEAPFGSGVPLQATLILEYKLPAATPQDVLGWAQQIHALGGQPFGEGYNAALQALTTRFAGRNARPGRVNGSAINAVRSNEVAFSTNGVWEMRQFALSPSTGRLVPATVERTPDISFNGTPTLASFVNANRDAIISETHTVPLTFVGQPFAAGAIVNDQSTWFVPGIDAEARGHFAINTCNGCHSIPETGTLFLQIAPRVPGSEAILSGFLTGETVSDPVTGAPRTFNDLARRRVDLESIVCPPPGLRAPVSLRRGISRVH